MITGLLILALWLSAAGAVAVGGISLLNGAAPEWAVLRSLGAFTALALMGLVAEAVMHHGVTRRRPLGAPGDPAEGERRARRSGDVLQPEVVSRGEKEAER